MTYRKKEKKNQQYLVNNRFSYSAIIPPSQQMYPLIGLNLLRLLSQNKLSEFHTTLESIDSDELQNNQFIKQAVDLGI